MSLTSDSLTCTPRRSPRLRGKRSERPAPILTPVRERLKKFVAENCEVKCPNQSGTKTAFHLKNFKEYINVQEVVTYASLSIELVTADVGDNMLKPFLLITRSSRVIMSNLDHMML